MASEITTLGAEPSRFDQIQEDFGPLSEKAERVVVASGLFVDVVFNQVEGNGVERVAVEDDVPAGWKLYGVSVHRGGDVVFGFQRVD
jgi:hypothetical protein